MIRLLFILLLLSIRAAVAASTNIPVDITITHPNPGGIITTSTWANYSGATMPAGTPVHFAQAWRYDDVPPGTYPAVQDAATHAALVYQWDNIDTAHENGGDGSWRHSVGIAKLAAPLANGASVTFEFPLVSGTYSQAQAVPLSNLCSGANAHALKIHLTDVRNQDDSVRKTGDATFDLCANINNTGRDAPRIVGSGSIRTEAQIMGQFVYTDSSKDPLLYVLCDVGLYTTGETEWVCHNMSPWMNVAAGSAGNAGAPGPVGFANDPQIISYRAAVQDGSTTVLDYSNFDATLQSPNSTVISCPDNYGGGAGKCLNVPSSTGANSWYWPQTVRVTSCTGVCVGGLTQGQLAWVYPSGIAAARAFTNTTSINLLASPELYGPASGTSLITTSQGTGSTTFQHRIWHVKWASWETMDTSADENWSLPGGTTRVTRRFYPHLASAEQTYWEETGIVPPILLSQTISAGIDYGQTASPPFYAPLARMNVIGLGGPGFRHDIGLINDFASQAFVTQAQNDWYLARIFTMGTPFHGWMGVLNEATGRIPPMNNGPLGSGGFGTGASYSQLGAPFPSLRFPLTTGGNMATPLQNVPNSNFAWEQGMWGLNGTGVDHTPAFGSLTYIMWGEQQFLEMLRWNANHDIYQSPTYAIEPQNLSYAVRDTQVTPGPGQGHAYYCNVLYQNQNRGSAWALRDITLPAALGGDSDQERIYYNDCITEMANSYPSINLFIDGTAPGNLGNSLTPPNFGGSGGTWDAIDVFIGDYMFVATYQMQTFLHSPMAASWIPKFTRWYQGLLGGGTVNGSLDPFYGIDFSASPAVHNGDCVMNGSVTGGDVGKCLNPTDASDYGGFGHYTTFTAGSGQLQQRLNAPTYTLQVGDTIKYQGVMSYSTAAEAIDQLPGNQWFKVLGPIDNNNGTYFVENPATPGTPFSQFTRNGTTFSELNGAVIYRPTFVPAPSVQGFFNSGYCVYARQTLTGLTILGQDVKTPLNNFIFRAGGDINNCVSSAVVAWDQTVVVPGSSSQPGPTQPSPPAPAVLAGFTTLALNSDWTQQMPLNWLGGCPNGADGSNPSDKQFTDDTGHVWWLNLWWFDYYNNCTVQQLTDPALGGLTLDIPWLVDALNFNYGKGYALQSASIDYTQGVRGQSNDYPLNAYFEATLRMTPVGLPAVFGAFNTWDPHGITDQSNIGLEDDFIELDQALFRSDAAVHNWGGSGNGAFVWQTTPGTQAPGGAAIDPSLYHTFGMLATSDGVSMWFCSYVDNIFQPPCLSLDSIGGLSAKTLASRQFLILQSFCDSWNYPQNHGCNDNDGQIQHMYVRNVRVWSCPTWATTQCLRPVITNPAASVSSIRLGSNSTTTGLPSGSAVGTLSVIMNPAAITFSYIGTNLHLSTSGADSGGVCNATNGAGNSSFQVINGDTLATNGSPTAGNKAICVAASQSGVSPAGQAFTIAVGNRIDAAATFCAANGGGNGTSGSPWHSACINAAINAAQSGDTVFLAAGNWVLNISEAPVNTAKAVNIVGAGSGNTFDAMGHPNNPGPGNITTGPNGTVTAVRSARGTYSQANSYERNAPSDSPPGNNSQCGVWSQTPGGWWRFTGSNQNVSHIFFDGSTASTGSADCGVLTYYNANGPGVANDVRVLQFNDSSYTYSPEGRVSFSQSQNVTIQNSSIADPVDISNAGVCGLEAFQMSAVNGVNITNVYLYQMGVNPITTDSFVANGVVMFTQDDSNCVNGIQPFPTIGWDGSGIGPGATSQFDQGNGSYHFTWSNSVTFAAGNYIGMGAGVNDPTTNGGVNDLNFTGNWLVGAHLSIDSCDHHAYDPGHWVGNTFNTSYNSCAPDDPNGGGMQINANWQPWLSCNNASTSDPPNRENPNSNNGISYGNNATNNSIIATTGSSNTNGNVPGVAQIVATGTGIVPCYPTFGQPGVPHTGTVVNFRAHQNYLSGPTIRYLSSSETLNPSVTGNFCVGGTFTQTDSTQCATTGFTQAPTASFALGNLSGSTVPFTSTSFTAQYGAVKWIASTSSTTPTSGDSRWSYVPPFSLSATHGNTVYLWVMDSANHISAPASAVVP